MSNELSPVDVRDFSSQYGSNRSSSYVVRNILCERPNIFPSYGDSTNALVFRTYGPWWLILPSYRANFLQNFPRCEPNFTSRDFIEIVFAESRKNCSTLNIYETFNPGSLEMVYAGEEIGANSIRWHRIWKFPEPFLVELKDETKFVVENGRQRIADIFPENLSEEIDALHLNADRKIYPEIFTRHSYPSAARLPRIVRVPLKNRIHFSTRHFRLEFDHKCVDYYTEIDTITLSVDESSTNEFVEEEKFSTKQNDEKSSSSIEITNLPFDTLFLICSHLDLRSLMRLASTCRYFRQVCYDPLNFYSLNLQPYWSGVDDSSIEEFFRHRCEKTRFLSLSWAKSISPSSFEHFLRPSAENLLQLNLSSCQFLTGEHIRIICDFSSQIQILNLDNCLNLNSEDFLPLANLTEIRSLNVYRTNVDYRTILPLIHRNASHLENLNLGSCVHLIDAVGIVRLIFSRCSKLRSIDLWRVQIYPNAFMSIVSTVDTSQDEIDRIERLPVDEQIDLTKIYSLTEMPVDSHCVSHFSQLAELDFGWTNTPTNFIKLFVQQAGRNLIKIFLTACRQTSNDDILAISQNCPRLRQFDMLNCNQISAETVEILLQRCQLLEFIDLSYCAGITDAHISKWKNVYPCSFKRSYTPRDQQNVSTEFP